MFYHCYRFHGRTAQPIRTQRGHAWTSRKRILDSESLNVMCGHFPLGVIGIEVKGCCVSGPHHSLSSDLPDWCPGPRVSIQLSLWTSDRIPPLSASCCLFACLYSPVTHQAALHSGADDNRQTAGPMHKSIHCHVGARNHKMPSPFLNRTRHESKRKSPR